MPHDRTHPERARPRPPIAVLLALLLALPLASSALAEPASASPGWIEGMAGAARAFLAGLGDAREARLPFAGAERGDWHYVPRARRGLPLNRTTPGQRAQALALLRATLSARGAAQAEAIMALEAVLARVEGSSPRFRDPGNYAVSVFGEPGRPPWGWRLEGHHLSLNVTVSAPGRVAFTPFFAGTNPARIPAGPRAGERVQQAEHDLGLALAQSLGEAQWRASLIGARSLGDVVTGPGRAASLASPQGVALGALGAESQKLALRLIEAYVGRARDEWGRPYLDLVRQGLPGTRLSWAGGRQAGEAFYYRIHGPRVLIECDNTQNRANHIHSLWRDPANDFGRDDLRAHYGAAAHHGLEGR